MRLRALRRFARVVRTGSIRRAARDIGIGQPQLTRQMRDLEQALGCVLMERGAAGIEPTPEGRLLYDIAVESERLWGDLTATSARRFVRELKTVRLGSIIPLAHEGRLARLLATLVSHWAPRDEHRLFLSSSTADDLLAGLKAGRFDAVLVDVDMLPDSFEHKDIMTSELALVGAPDSSVDGAEEGGDGPPPLESWLKERRFALPSDRTGLRHRIRALMEAGGLDGRRLDDALEIDSVAVILRLVIEHGFASVLPLDAVRALSTPLLLRPLGPGSHISYRLVWLPTHASRLAASAIEAAFLRLSAPGPV
ncbi:LysR family transcriptional regulator [Radicibacter daui]|uniref:LysR family transcriptional regulator n=1 Tax=Radicibacter daui TaxID=3064829 RepID=UPI004046D2BE